MKKLSAHVIGMCMLALTLVGFSVAPSDAAATTQRICSSSASKYTFYLLLPNGKIDPVNPTECYTVPKGTQVRITTYDYYVGYDKRPYSGCRHNGYPGFVPYQKPDLIYFKVPYSC